MIIKFSKETNKEVAKIVVNSVKLFVVLEIVLIILTTWMTYADPNFSGSSAAGNIVYTVMFFSGPVAIGSFFTVALFTLVRDSFKLVNKKK